MKIQQLVIIALIIGFSKCGRLDETENQKRSDNCGRQMLTIPKGNDVPMKLPKDQWLVKVDLAQENIAPLVETLYLQSNGEHALGSFISPRHILTSSQPVMNDKKQWIWNSLNVKDEEYLNGTDNLNVPIDNFGKNRMLYVTRHTPENFTDLGLPKAWILKVRHQDEIDRMRSPMVIELESDVNDVEFPCLVDENHHLEKNAEVHIYGYNNENRDLLLYRRKTFEKYYCENENKGRFVLVEGKFKADKDRGGPMVRTIENRVTVLSIGASQAFPDYAGSTYFFDVRFLLKDICLVSGICPITATTSPPSTTPATQGASVSPSDPSAPTSNAPTQSSASVSTSTSQPTPPWSTKDPRKPPKPENQEHIVEDKEEDDEDEEEDEEEEEEWDDYQYIVVTADFLNGTGGMELNFLLFLGLLGLRYLV